MRIYKNFLYITIVVFGLGSCKKSTPAPQKPIDSGPDIYLAGTATRFYDNDPTIAVCWKNKVAHKLTDSLTISSTVDMVRNGNDVYIVGATIAPGDYIPMATYWKNGKPVTIGYDSNASSIAVSGNDVYLAYNGVSEHGFDQSFYWKNGTLNPLMDGSQFSFTRAILLNGNDLYVTGSSSVNGNDDDNEEATYWKNGNMVKLVDSRSSYFSVANAINIQGNDVYIAGTVRAEDGYEAVYWKNGVKVKLAANLQDAEAFAIAVKDSDVYVAGRINQDGVYWKNGVQTKLSNGTISSITLDGNDVYFVGDDNLQACYWKNGKKVVLPRIIGFSDFATACKLIIVPH